MTKNFSPDFCNMVLNVNYFKNALTLLKIFYQSQTISQDTLLLLIHHSSPLPMFSALVMTFIVA